MLIEISKIMREMEATSKLQTTTKTVPMLVRLSQSLKRPCLWPKAIQEASLITIKTAGEESIERSKLKLLRLSSSLKLKLTEN